MDYIFNVLALLGGLALFLYGMDQMGDGLTKLSGGKLEKILEKLTNNPIKGVFLGAIVTCVIQSSSATTVMVVGFVNAGIMKLRQGIGIIMGANIGTTITAWILSLSGIEGESFVVQMLKPANFWPIFALLGAVFVMFFKSEKKKNIGLIALGFGVLMYGMDTMSNAVSFLKDVPAFGEILLMFTNPILGVLAGALLTAIIQSSSASVGILQALSQTGKIKFGAAVPIILGQNIGTCVTALLSSVGTSKNARRAAVVHLYFNIIGTTIFLIGYYTLNAIFEFPFADSVVTETSIAIVHTTFNVTVTCLLLPFTKGLEKLACLTIKDTEKDIAIDKDFQILEERFLDTPSFAIEQCNTVAVKMAELSRECITKAIGLADNYNEEDAKLVVELEDRIDKYEDALGTYLIKISSKNLTVAESNNVSVLLNCIGDFERISDHAVNLYEAAKELNDKGQSFSENALAELHVLKNAIDEILENATKAFVDKDMKMAKTIEPLEEVVDDLCDELKSRHIARLKDGKCTIELGFVFSDFTTNLERVSDHCSNIAVCVIEVLANEFDAHSYIDKIKHDDESFKLQYKEYKQKYLLP